MSNLARGTRKRLSARLARARVVAGMGSSKKEQVEEEEQLPLVEAKRRKCCVLCVGQTGSGKSATVTRLSLRRAESSAGFERKTQSCQAYKPVVLKEEEVEGGGFWSDPALWVVDTVGWQDEAVEDETLFQDILRYLREGGFTHVSAVVWNVIPNVRRDAALSKHASLIDQIAEGVWANVVVVCKQSMRPGRDGGGAAAAAREVMAEGAGEGERNVLPQVTGYRFLSDFADDAAQLDKMESDEESRRAFNVMTDPEVRSHLTGCLERCGPALELVFRDSKCLDCGAVADARLMPPLCHMESHRTHPEAAARAHPGARERYHPGETGAVHPGTLRRLWYGRLVGRRAKRFSCCGRRTGRPGCAARWRCCDRGEGEDGCESRFSCCRVDVGKEEEEEEAGLQGCQMLHPCCGRSEGRPGCEERCRKCGALWGTRAPGELEDGDGRGGGGCYRRRHNVVGQWKTEEEEEEERRRAEERKRAEREAEDRTTMGMEPMVLLKPF